MSRCSACYGKGYYVLTLVGEDDYQVVVCECQVTMEREMEDGN
jgi:hypothetical protein